MIYRFYLEIILFFQIMPLIYNYDPAYKVEKDFDKNGNIIINTYTSDDNCKNNLIFKMLDNYYRYGVTFIKNFDYIRFNHLSYHDRFNETFYKISMDYKINLELFDNGFVTQRGELIISEIEKWKRKVIKKKKNQKAQLSLFEPNIYHSFIVFYAYYDLDHLLINNFNYANSRKGFVPCIINRKFKLGKYEHVKKYEDKLYKKILSKDENFFLK